MSALYDIDEYFQTVSQFVQKHVLSCLPRALCVLDVLTRRAPKSVVLCVNIQNTGKVHCDRLTMIESVMHTVCTFLGI